MKAKDNDEIDVILESDENLYLIDQSGWPSGRVLSVTTRDHFVSEILQEELVIKRLRELRAIRQGLDDLMIVGHLQVHEQAMRRLFVAGRPVH